MHRASGTPWTLRYGRPRSPANPPGPPPGALAGQVGSYHPSVYSMRTPIHTLSPLPGRAPRPALPSSSLRLFTNSPDLPLGRGRGIGGMHPAKHVLSQICATIDPEISLAGGNTGAPNL